ncbi:MAG: hypothetical protein LBO74_15240 [Candidatus Symbiothrix sp.]|jgi:hypothetical protein|nr:hypothetical protein [Candidatus Symbiothrix sp.]
MSKLKNFVVASVFVLGCTFFAHYSTNFKEISDCEDEDCERWIGYDDYGYQVIKENSTEPIKKTGWSFLKKGTPKGMVERIEKAIRHLNSFCERDDDLF